MSLKARKICSICESEIELEEDAVKGIGDPVHWFCLQAESTYAEHCNREEENQIYNDQ